MRHAVVVLVLAASFAFALRPAPARAAGNAVVSISGIGLIDYSQKPTFKVGDWCKYHLKARSEMGEVDDYLVTVLIAGEERWWGEDCFWIETWTERKGEGPSATAALMSYDVFNDSLALPHMQLYVRKTIDGVKEDGTPDQRIYKLPTSAVKSRDPIGANAKLRIEPQGNERITTPKGSFDCRKVLMQQGTGRNGVMGDSSDYTELREVRTTFLANQIPITHIVREDIETSMTRKAWLAGHSQTARTVTMDRSKGSAELVDFGSDNKARLVPESLRKAIVRGREETPEKPATRPRVARRRTG